MPSNNNTRRLQSIILDLNGNPIQPGTQPQLYRTASGSLFINPSRPSEPLRLRHSNVASSSSSDHDPDHGTIIIGIDGTCDDFDTLSDYDDMPTPTRASTERYLNEYLESDSSEEDLHAIAQFAGANDIDASNRYRKQKADKVKPQEPEVPMVHRVRSIRKTPPELYKMRPALHTGHVPEQFVPCEPPTRHDPLHSHPSDSAPGCPPTFHTQAGPAQVAAQPTRHDSVHSHPSPTPSLPPAFHPGTVTLNGQSYRTGLPKPVIQQTISGEFARTPTNGQPHLQWSPLDHLCRTNGLNEKVNVGASATRNVKVIPGSPKEAEPKPQAMELRTGCANHTSGHCSHAYGTCRPKARPKVAKAPALEDIAEEPEEDCDVWCDIAHGEDEWVICRFQQ